jgi:hypothetical protein
MATAVLRSHDALANRMHLDAFAASPVKPRRRRHPKPASPPPKVAVPAVASPAPPKQAPVASSPPKGRRSPPAKPARKQPSPTKETPKPQVVLRILKRGEEPPAPAPAPAPSPAPAPVQAKAQAPPADRRVRSPSPPTAPVQARAQAPPTNRRARAPSPPSPPVPARAQAPPADKRVLSTTGRIGPQAPAVVPTKKIVSVAANAATYAGPAFSVAAPEPSSLPLPGFFRRAEEEATRGLRCLLRIGELS